MGIHIVGDNNIPTESEKKNKKFDPDALKGFFSDGVPKIAKETSSERNKQVKNINPKDMRKLEAIDLKDRNWEYLKPSRKIENNPEDSKAIRPSRSEAETIHGVNGMIPGAMSSVFDDYKESDYTKHVISSGEKKRQDRKNKGKPTAEQRSEWEVPSRAKTTADVPVTDRGIIPNRSAFGPPDLPKVKIKAVDRMQQENRKSAAAGKLAAKIKSEMDKASMERERNISKNWEEEAMSKIQENYKKEINYQPEKIKIANDFTPIPSNKKTFDLNGIFTNPVDVPEKKIKRNSDILKEKRKKREEDRSWEVVVRSGRKK
jgi:hypothetical protein